MNIIIEVYIFVCIMLLLFDIGFLVVKNIKNHKFYPKKSVFIKQVQNEFLNFEPSNGLTIEFKESLLRKIKKTKNLIALQNQLEIIEKYKEEIYSEIRPYIMEQLEVYKQKSNYEQAYYCYVISKLDIKENDTNKKFYSNFLSFLDSSSLYTFTNAMNAIYHFGNAYILTLAIDKVDERNGFYHKKLFIDGMIEFSGDNELLHKLIIDKFKKYAPLTQESILDYFRLKGVDISDFCLNILKEKNLNPQVLYAGIRYFAKYPCDETKQIFIDILQNDNSNWIEQMLAIQALMKHNDNNIKKLIEAKVTDRNWYIRTNAIAYLHSHHISRNDIFNILFLKDKYANEALLYQYKDDREMSEYIINTIQMLNKEQFESEDLNIDLVLATV